MAYVPNAMHTLILPQQLLDTGCCIVFDQLHGFQFFLDDQLGLLSYCSGNLFYFNITFFAAAALSTSPAAILSVFSPVLCIDLIHHCLGHACEEHCHEFVWQSMDLSDWEKCKILLSSLTPLCSMCLAGKQTVHGVSCQLHTNHALHGGHPGDLISLDLIRPMRHWSAGGHMYLLTIMDSFSRMHFVRLLPNKSSIAIQNALRSIATTFPPTLQLHHVQLDNMKELDALISEWITEAGGKHEPTPPYTSEYNGVTERFNCEIMTCVRCLLFDACLPSEWWAEAT
jgi:hypothetical protein